jgi:hypothetical protein
MELEGRMLFLARIVRTATKLAAAVIVAGILLYVLGAKQSNEVVSAVMDAGRWLVGPFDDLFTMDDRKVELAVNWGIAAFLWALIGGLVARALGTASGVARRRRVA